MNSFLPNGIRYPLIQAPMAGVQDARLAMAVSAAGGLGSLAFGSPYLLESAGGATATLSAFKTALGVASAIVGQGGWATYAGSVGSVVAPQSNLFPYPRPTRDARG